MSDVQAKIDEIEAEMARTQKNKATNYHLGTLKAKLAKLRSELLNGPGGKGAGTKNAERGFDVTKSGDTRIGLGKKMLLFLLLLLLLLLEGVMYNYIIRTGYSCTCITCVSFFF